MNPSERVAARLRGDPVDQPPNFNLMMQFGAHFVCKPLSAYYQDYRVLCEANFAVQEAFGIDLLQAISDPYREAADAGLTVIFPDDSLLLAPEPLIKEPTDLARLRFPRPEDGPRMTDRLNAVRLFSERADGQIPVMGWVEGPLAEAANIRGVGQMMTDLIDRPEWVRELLEVCVETEIAFAVAQIEAGADIVGLGDAIASQISPRAYREFALPYERRVFAAVRERGAIPRLHICGDTNRILSDMAQSGAAIIDLDWPVDMAKAAELFGECAVPCGQHDPVAVMLRGDGDSVAAAVEASLRAGGPRCISMAGCEIPDGTPHENLRAHARTLAAWGGSR
jgi:MtaA/CmuA family methyltransferase